MWDMRRNLDTTPMPRGRSTIQFIYGGLPEARRNWWLIVEPDKEVDLCAVDPGHDVDLYVTTDLRTMTEDRKSGVKGKSVSVRVDLGGSRDLKKKQTERKI